MEPFLNGTDHLNIRDAIKETSSMAQTTVVLHRFSSYTPTTDPRSSKTRVNVDFSVPCRVYNISAKDVLNSGGFYMMGDVETDSVFDIIGTSNVKNSVQQPDQMTYNGQLYQVVGMPKPVTAAGGRVKTVTLWRKI